MTISDLVLMTILPVGTSSPVLIQIAVRTLSATTVLICPILFMDGGKFDAHSRYEIIGFYKGIPIKLSLCDSFARYEPDYHFLPEIVAVSMMTPDGLPAFNG